MKSYIFFLIVAAVMALIFWVPSYFFMSIEALKVTYWIAIFFAILMFPSLYLQHEKSIDYVKNNYHRIMTFRSFYFILFLSFTLVFLLHTYPTLEKVTNETQAVIISSIYLIFFLCIYFVTKVQLKPSEIVKSIIKTGNKKNPKGKILKNENNDLESLSSEDIEMLLFGVVAFWGDGSISKEEMDKLKQKCQDRLDNLSMVSFSHFDDKDFSIKEYIVELFDLIKKLKEQSENYVDFELPDKFLKKITKQLKNPEDLIKYKIFYMLLNEIQGSYIDDVVEFEIEYEKLNEKQEKDKAKESKSEKKPDVDVNEEGEIIEKKLEQLNDKKPINVEKRYKSLLKELKDLADIGGVTKEEKSFLQLFKSKRTKSWAAWIKFTLIMIILVGLMEE